MSTNFKKIHVGRKRFIKTPPLKDPSEWLAELAGLKDFLATSTSFQIVGHKVYFEISMDDPAPRLMLEVLGVPVALDQNNLVLADQEATDELVHRLEGGDLFGIDLDQLIATAKTLQQSLKNTLLRSNSGICDLFQIVYDNEKIELHFFIQKDYIQKQF